MTVASPLVSVIIPSIGRPELSAAVESVRAQVGVDTEIVVVADLADDTSRADAVRAAAHGAEVVFTGGGKRAAYARNLGVATSRGDWVAFLDDDDVWLSEKLATQLTAASDHDATVISSRVDQRAMSSGETVASGVPIALLQPDQSPAEYLFRRRRPGAGRASLFTSTLLVSQELAVGVPWEPSLRRHQDWDWVIRLAQHPKYRFHHAPETLSVIQVGTASSISAGSDWEASLAWATKALGSGDRNVYVDFAFAQTMRYALHARSSRGVREVFAVAWKTRTLPAGGPLVIGAAGILGRRGIERAMAAVR